MIGFEKAKFMTIFVAMGTEQYIAELLYRYNCVIMPGFGGFLTQMKSAVIHSNSHSFSPPSKVLSFNGQLSSNDGLLVSYMAESEKVSYEEMLQRIEKESSAWKQTLKDGKRLTLPNVGEVWENKDQKIQFQPSNQVNYLTTSFGLSSFVTAPVVREVLKEEVLEIEDKIPFMITPEVREQSNGFRPYLKYAAVILLAFATGLTGLRFYNNTINDLQLVQEEAQEQVARNIQEATFFNTAPLELPALKLEITKKNQVHYHIVAGGFRAQENADKKVAQLTEKGFEASNLGINKHGLHLVAYGSFTNVEEALQYLRQIKRTESSDAWLFQE
ncbi:MAG: hypothetical protein ACI9Q4_000159 [Sediminicola sp.]